VLRLKIGAVVNGEIVGGDDVHGLRYGIGPLS